jgi:uncharacterized protein (UPF0333 family)
MKKGQVSMEFILSIIMLVMIFVFSLYIYMDRNDFNNRAELRTSAQEVADRIARNINTIYLMDNNAILKDNILWTNESTKDFNFIQNYIFINYLDGSFVSRKVLADVNFDVTDLNGLIYFRKKQNIVVVSYE